MTSLWAAILGLVASAQLHAAEPTAAEHPRSAATTPAEARPVAAGQPSAPSTEFANLHGKPIRGSTGEKLGEVADLVVDVSAGEIPYVLVASPLAPGEGYRLRLVPTGALEQARRGNGYMVPFEGGQWRNLDSIDARQLKAGALQAFEAHRQQLARVFGLVQAGAAPSRLLLATHLRGKGLRHAGERLGTVEAILAGVDRRKALALVRAPESNEASTFVVPLTRLQLAAFAADDFTTDLTREELESSRPVKVDLAAALSVSTEVGQILAASMLSQSSVSGQKGYAGSSVAPDAAAPAVPTPPLQPPPPGGARADELTPTGLSSHEANTAQIEAALRAVRTALARDPSVPARDIEVEVREGRMILRGTVPSAAIRQRIEEVARRSVPHAPLDNQLIVPAR